MDAAGLRAWWAHRQGLDGSLEGADPAEVLEATGWSRERYLTLHARTGIDRPEIDAAVDSLAIHELPAARGCPYDVPASQFGLALACARAVAPPADTSLCDAVVDALADEPLDRAAIAACLGTTGPLDDALARLQADGRVRFDRRRDRYVRWDDAPAPWSWDAARRELVRCYLSWAGPATTAHIGWFTGFDGAEIEAALADLEVVDVSGGLLLLADDVPAFEAYERPRERQVSLLAGTDALFLLRREEVESHAIVDRGELVGLWDQDAVTGAIAWDTFSGPTEEVRMAVKATQAFLQA